MRATHPHALQESSDFEVSIEQLSTVVLAHSALPVAQVAASLEAALCIGAAPETSCSLTPIGSSNTAFSLLRVLTGAASLTAPTVNATALATEITNVSVVVDELTVVLVSLLPIAAIALSCSFLG